MVGSILWQAHKGQRKTCRSQFFPLTRSVLGLNLCHQAGWPGLSFLCHFTSLGWFLNAPFTSCSNIWDGRVVSGVWCPQSLCLVLPWLKHAHSTYCSYCPTLGSYYNFTHASLTVSRRETVCFSVVLLTAAKCA